MPPPHAASLPWLAWLGSFFVVRVVLPALLMIAASAASHLFERAWRFFVVAAGIVSAAAPPTAVHAPCELRRPRRRVARSGR
eukprot:982225-Prymnesium_polylepis.2